MSVDAKEPREALHFHSDTSSTSTLTERRYNSSHAPKPRLTALRDWLLPMPMNGQVSVG